jgi:LAGLIDADG DNA endonuclease family
LTGTPLCACGCGEKVTLQRKKYSKYLYGHDKHPDQWELVLSTRERQAILGTLLGDGSIGFPNKRSTNCRLAWTHGPDQAWWMQYKAKILSRLQIKLTVAENAGYGTTSIRAASTCLPCLTEIRHLVYGPHERKTVTLEWLDEIGDIGLAWWFCDDGSFNKQHAIFHTEGYTLDENNLIAGWFKARFGGAGISANGKGHYFVRLHNKPTALLFSRIERFVPMQFAYKIGKGGSQRGFGL